LTIEALRSFATIQERTACPFAKLATLWGAPLWDRQLDVEGNAHSIASALRQFSRLQRWHVLDGFVVEIDDERKVMSFRDLCTTFVSLNALDEASSNLFLTDVRSVNWRFCFCDVRMFVTISSPLYGPDSPRETDGHRSTFVFFQPEPSFLDRNQLFGIFRERFANIRQRFADIGKPNDCEIMSRPYRAPRYVKPLRLGDPEVEWWSG
jgi:hypothetical protein